MTCLLLRLEYGPMGPVSKVIRGPSVGRIDIWTDDLIPVPAAASMSSLGPSHGPTRPEMHSTPREQSGLPELHHTL